MYDVSTKIWESQSSHSNESSVSVLHQDFALQLQTPASGQFNCTATRERAPRSNGSRPRHNGGCHITALVRSFATWARFCPSTNEVSFVGQVHHHMNACPKFCRANAPVNRFYVDAVAVILAIIGLGKGMLAPIFAKNSFQCQKALAVLQYRLPAQAL